MKSKLSQVYNTSIVVDIFKTKEKLYDNIHGKSISHTKNDLDLCETLNKNLHISLTIYHYYL